MTSEKRVIARNVLASIGVRMLQVASAFVLLPFLLRGFGLADYGVFALASSLSVYVGLLDFGVNQTIVKYVAEYRARGEHERLRELLSNGTAYYVAMGLVATVLLLAFALFGVELLRLGPVDAALAKQLFIVAAAISLLSWPLGVGAAVLNGLQRYDLSSIVNAFVIVGSFAVTVAVLVFGGGPVALLAAMGCITLLGSAAACVMASLQLGGLGLSFGLLSRGGMRTIFRFSWMVFVMQISGAATDEQTDRFVLATFAGATPIGLYDPISRLNGMVSQLASFPAAVLVPAASHLDAQRKTASLRSLYIRGSKYTVAFVAPVAMGLITLAHPLLLTWLGPKLAVMTVPAQIFLVVWLMYANLVVAFAIFVGIGRLRFLMWFNLGTAALNFFLSVLLVQRFGVLGVIVGTVAADTLLFPLGMWYTFRVFEIRIAEYLRRVVMPTYPLLAVTVALAVAAEYVGLTSTLLGVAVAGIGCVVAYWAVVYRLGLEPAEKDDVRMIVTALVARFSRSSEAESSD
jgi:O-antigen/teichoic acid export membrane protein